MRNHGSIAVDKDERPMLLARIGQLEERARSVQSAIHILRIALLAAVVVPTTVFVLGAATNDGVLRVKGRLTLQDVEGNSRAHLQVKADGVVTLTFCDRHGHDRMVIGMAGDGSPGLALLDTHGKQRVSLAHPTDGSAALVFNDAAENERLGVGFDNTVSPRVTMRDGAGKARLAFMIRADGTAKLGILGRDESSGLTAAAEPDGIAVLNARRDGLTRASFGLMKDGVAALTFLNARKLGRIQVTEEGMGAFDEKKLRLAVGFESDRETGLYLYDTKEQKILSLESNGERKPSLRVHSQSNPGIDLLGR